MANGIDLNLNRFQGLGDIQTSSTVDDLLKIMTMFRQMKGDQDKKQGNHTVAYGEYYRDIHNQSDPGNITEELDRLNVYYEENKDGMNSEQLENYNFLIQQGQYHLQDMDRYNTELNSNFTQYQTDYTNLVEEYNGAPDAGGAGVRTKDIIANEMNAQVVDYVNWSSGFYKKYGNQLATANFAADKLAIDDFDDILRVGISMMKDNYTNEEIQILNEGLTQKSMEPLDNHVLTKAKMKFKDAVDARNRGQGLIQEINKKGELLTIDNDLTRKYESIQLGTEPEGSALWEEWNLIKDAPAYQYVVGTGQDREVVSLTNQEILSRASLMGQTQGGYEINIPGLFSQYEFDIKNAEKKLEIDDKIYINSGTGESITSSFPLLYKTPVTPTTPTTTITTTPTQVSPQSSIQPVAGLPAYKQQLYKQQQAKPSTAKGGVGFDYTGIPAPNYSIKWSRSASKNEKSKISSLYNEIMSEDIDEFTSSVKGKYVSHMGDYDTSEAKLETELNKLRKMISKSKAGKSPFGGGVWENRIVKKYQQITRILEEAAILGKK